MKILIIGSERNWAFENHYIKHLKKSSEVVSLPAHDYFYDYYYKSIWNKIKFRTGFSRIYHRINNRVLENIFLNHYDVVWIFKGMEIYPQTIREIRKTGTKVVNFNPDHPFLHTFKGSGNRNVRDSVPEYDLHLCYNLQVKEKIEKEYKIQAEWLPFGYEPHENIILPSQSNEIKRACFIGNPDKYRAEVLSDLATTGIAVDIYGDNWQQWIRTLDSMDINFYPAVFKKDFNTVATQYRLQLNIFRPHNVNSHNMRSIEMPGLGCIMLAPKSQEHNLLFKENSEAVFYNNIEEMKTKANNLLKMPYEQALALRKNALQRSQVSGYSYRDHTEKVLEIFQRLTKRSQSHA